ncbi:YhjD/YihY/BrkB family envelope integrity protein [Micromonospora sp. DT81.3]|uniref:YhjD/YihY/BrkB family envelope integrity protein n=1 Tax=Actinomycetes TaxID=1760 RepID=UPI003CF67A71
MLRVGREVGGIQLVDRGMTLAAHAFTSVLPILIVAGAVRSRLDPQSGPIVAEHLGLDAATAEILEKSLPGGAQELRATGVIGVVLLVIAATSFARALERSVRTIWRAPASSVKSAWRWFAAVIAVIAGLSVVVASRILLRGDGAASVVGFAVEVAAWALLWWIASWLVVNRRVTLRQLLPGALLAGAGFATAGLLGRLVLPPLLADSANRFGVLGMAFTYIGWLLVLAWILLIAMAVGRVAYLSQSGRAWRNSVSYPAGRAASGERRTSPNV